MFQSRDGVSEGQFGKVLAFELLAMREACKVRRRFLKIMGIRFWQKLDLALCASNEGRFSKVFQMIILYNIYTFGVRRPL